MSIQSRIARCASLDQLPDELLFEIVAYFKGQKSIPKRYRIGYTLSQVNRRMREFGLLVLAEDISVATCDHFFAAVHSLRKDGRAGHVRRVQIGYSKERAPYMDAFPPFWFSKDVEGGVFPLPHLTSFSCWQANLSAEHLRYLYGSPLLTSLTVLLYENCEPIDFEQWPMLRTLRIEFCEKIKTFDSPVAFPSYAHLTTLAVNDHIGSEWLDSHLRQARFPSLRVLSLQYAGSPPWLVYQFIHRHPTLLEVNVSFNRDRDYWFAWDRLLKLIDGTGTWGPDPNAPGSKFDDPEFTFRTIPDVQNETYTVSTHFAFSRTPLYPEATQWDQSGGSKRPRYTATGLALYVVDQCLWEDGDMMIMRFHEFLERMHRVFPEMVELRMAYGTPYVEDNFEDVMKACSSSLRNWTSLRKLAFSWGTLQDEDKPFPDYFQWCQGPYREPHILDQVHPPIHIERDYFDGGECQWVGKRPHPGEAYTARQLKDAFDLEMNEVGEMWEAIRAACDHDIDDGALMDTKGLPLQAWIARHEPLVAKMMRRLATNCPTLESIAWYPVGETIWCSPVRWLWKVHREKDTRAIRMLSDEFTYLGCPQGDPPAFWVLVGQELAVAEEYPAMVHRKSWKDTDSDISGVPQQLVLLKDSSLRIEVFCA